MAPEDVHIPGYDLEAVLGKGGMATVYRARQHSFAREVALKVLNPTLAADDDFTQRFMQESLIVARLHHSHIVQVYDVGQFRQYSYICMEYLSGGHLAKRLAGGVTLKQSVTLLRQLASALDFAHRKNIVHRDIKPENILFREDEAAVLTDFGVAKELQANCDLTRAGLVIGTPKYMSPEQFDGSDVDHRADLYSLGIVFFRCLTSSVPFVGKSMISTAYQHHNEPIPRLPDAVACFQPIIDRLLAKDQRERFQRGSEVLDALERIACNAFEAELTNLDVAAAVKLAPPVARAVRTKPANDKAAGQPAAAAPKVLQPTSAAATTQKASVDSNKNQVTARNTPLVEPHGKNAKDSATIIRSRAAASAPRARAVGASDPLAAQAAPARRHRRRQKSLQGDLLLSEPVRPRAPLWRTAVAVVALCGLSAAGYAYVHHNHPSARWVALSAHAASTVSQKVAGLQHRVNAGAWLQRLGTALHDVVPDGQKTQSVAGTAAGHEQSPAEPFLQTGPSASPSASPFTDSAADARPSAASAALNLGAAKPASVARQVKTPGRVKAEAAANAQAHKRRHTVSDKATDARPAPHQLTAQQKLAARIDQLLTDAHHNLEGQPFGRQAALNALAQYKTVLELDAQHPAGHKGVERVAQRFLALAELAVQTGSYEEAQAYIIDAKAILPRHPKILRAQRKLTLAQLALYETRRDQRTP